MSLGSVPLVGLQLTGWVTIDRVTIDRVTIDRVTIDLSLYLRPFISLLPFISLGWRASGWRWFTGLSEPGYNGGGAGVEGG